MEGDNMGKRSYNGLFNQIVERVMQYDGRVYFVTLTMKDDNVLNKNSIGNFFNKLKYRGVEVEGYLWIKELQKRGVVHYHVLVLVPEKMRNFYDKVNESWGYGFVFTRGVEKKKVRGAIKYIMKYIKKELNQGSENEKMKRRIGRGGMLRFRTESFVDRVVKFSEFQFVGCGSTKGMAVKIYRASNLVMFVAYGVNGVSIHIVDWANEIHKILERFKFGLDAGKIGTLLSEIEFLALTKEEKDDVIGFHRFDREINRLLRALKII